MPRTLIAVLPVAVLVSGCVTHRSIPLDPPDRAAMSAVASEVAEGWAELVLEGDSVPQALRVRLDEGALRWETPDGERHTVDPAQIRRIEIRDRRRGLIEGILGGVAVAAVAAGVVAVCCGAQPGAWIEPEYVAGVGTAVVAVPLGALIGAVRGHSVILRPY